MRDIVIKAKDINSVEIDWTGWLDSWKKRFTKRLNSAQKNKEAKDKELHSQMCGCKHLQAHSIYCRNCQMISTDLSELLTRCPRCDAKVISS